MYALPRGLEMGGGAGPVRLQWSRSLLVTLGSVQFVAYRVLLLGQLDYYMHMAQEANAAQDHTRRPLQDRGPNLRRAVLKRRLHHRFPSKTPQQTFSYLCWRRRPS